MRTGLMILLSLMAVGSGTSCATAENGYPRRLSDSGVDGGTAVTAGVSELDYARQREAELRDAAARQERENAELRADLRGSASRPNALADASSQAASDRKKVRELELRVDVAERQLDEVRNERIARFESRDDVAGARRNAAAAAAEVDRLAGPILDSIADRPDYVEAQALMDAAAQAGEAQAMLGADAKRQAEADAAFEQASEAVRAIELAATNADPKVVEARKALKVAEDTLAQMRSEFVKTLEDEVSVRAARTNVETERGQLELARHDLATSEGRVAALRDPNGPEAEKSLKAGEDRLAELNRQLDEARIARADQEERSGVNRERYGGGSAESPRLADGGGVLVSPPVVYTPVYSPVYTQPYYSGYSYPYSYGYAYDDCYYPAWGLGLYFGSGWYGGWRHYYRHDYRYDDYLDRYRYYGYSGYGRRWDGDRVYLGGRFAGDRDYRRYDFQRPDSLVTARDRDARVNLDRARLGTLDAERDYRYRTGAGYAGLNSAARLRSSAYEVSVRERRAAFDDEARRRGTEDRTRSLNDEASRSAREDRASSARYTQGGIGGESRGRSVSSDARANEARVNEARVNEARAADEARVRRAGDSGRSDAGRSDRGRSSRSSASDESAARAASEARATNEARAARAADEARSARANDAARSRESSRGVESSRGSDVGRSREAARSGDVGRSRDSGRSEGGVSRSRGDSGASSSGGSSRGGGSGGGSSSSGGSSRGGGGSSSGGGGRR